MSKITSGILGPYSGTIGSVTGYRRNGKNIIQARKKFTSLAQKENLVNSQVKSSNIGKNLKILDKGIERIATAYNLENPNTLEYLMKNFPNTYVPERPTSLRWLILNPEFYFPEMQLVGGWDSSNNRMFIKSDNAISLVGSQWFTHYQLITYTQSSNALTLGALTPIPKSIQILNSIPGINVRTYRFRGWLFTHSGKPNNKFAVIQNIYRIV